MQMQITLSVRQHATLQRLLHNASIRTQGVNTIIDGLNAHPESAIEHYGELLDQVDAAAQVPPHSTNVQQVIAQLQRGMDGHGSRMSAAGRDHFNWCIRRLQDPTS